MQYSVCIVNNTCTGNESHKKKSYEEIYYDKITTLKATVRAIKGVELYDLIQAIKMCQVPNMVTPKTLCVPEFIKYTRTQCSIIHLNSYYNKMAKVVYDEKLMMHFSQDNLSG